MYIIILCIFFSLFFCLLYSFFNSNNVFNIIHSCYIYYPSAYYYVILLLLSYTNIFYTFPHNNYNQILTKSPYYFFFEPSFYLYISSLMHVTTFLGRYFSSVYIISSIYYFWILLSHCYPIFIRL